MCIRDSSRTVTTAMFFRNLYDSVMLVSVKDIIHPELVFLGDWYLQYLFKLSQPSSYITLISCVYTRRALPFTKFNRKYLKWPILMYIEYFYKVLNFLKYIFVKNWSSCKIISQLSHVLTHFLRFLKAHTMHYLSGGSYISQINL